MGIISASSAAAYSIYLRPDLEQLRAPIIEEMNAFSFYESHEFVFDYNF